MSKQQTITLNNGISIPVIGLGTWESKPNEVKDAVTHALSVGYRHIDGAWVYGNEAEIGEALSSIFSEKGGKLKRSDLFITSKLWCHKHHPDDIKSALQDTLQKLKTDYIDLYLVHWPMDFVRGDNPFPFKNDKAIRADPPISLEDTWRGMEDLVETGLVKAIGISNYNLDQVKTILKHARIPPAVLQVECHPYFQEPELMAFCKEHDITITAYSPLGNPSVAEEKSPLNDSVITNLAKKYNKSPAQVLLRWAIDRGFVVIPKSTKNERIEENFDIFDFSLDKKDLEQIAGLDKNKKFIHMDPALEHPYYPYHKDSSN